MSIWQSESWQNMLVKSWQSEEYFVLEMNYNSVNTTQVFVEKRSIALWKFGLFVIGFQWEIDQRLEENLKQLCQEENCLFAQIETLDYNENLNAHLGDREYFKQGYYKKFIPPYTAVIDLAKSEEEILAAMKPKGRYNIRLAEKKWVVVEQVDKNPYNAKKFFELMQETTSRDNFAGNTLKYYENFLENIENSQLFFAYYEENIIAAGIFVFDGETALYYYGASGNSHRNLMAPYLLQWTAICHAKKRGCKTYDFLWIATPWEQSSELAGVTDFKMKLTPDARKVSESYIFVSQKLLYWCIVTLKRYKG